MDMSKLSFLFQPNNVFKTNTRQKAAPSDALSQLSDKMIQGRQGGTESESAAKTREIKLDSYVKVDSIKPLEEMPTGVLETYFQIFKLFSHFSSGQEQDLQAFKERLQGMDQTIQALQDMADGKSALAEGVNMEDVVNSLAEAKQIREQFWNDGVKQLNRRSVGHLVKHDTYDKYAQRVLGENMFSSTDYSAWRLDASAPDAYAEIDRVLDATHGVTEELNRGTGHIYGILRSRGLGDRFQRFMEANRTERLSIFDTSKVESIQQLMLERLKNASLHEVQASDQSLSESTRQPCF